MVAAEGNFDPDGRYVVRTVLDLCFVWKLICIRPCGFPIYKHPVDSSPPLLLPHSQLNPNTRPKVLQHPINHVLIQHYRSGTDMISVRSDKTIDVVTGSMPPETNEEWISYDKRPLNHRDEAKRFQNGERINWTIRHIVKFYYNSTSNHCMMKWKSKQCRSINEMLASTHLSSCRGYCGRLFETF